MSPGTNTLAGPVTESDGSYLTVRTCPACGSLVSRLVHRLDLCTPGGHPLGNGYAVVSCLVCGAGYANADVSQPFYETYYARQAKYAAEASTRADRPASPGRSARDVEPDWVLERFERAAQQIAAVVPEKTARMLDIGCATGNLLSALARRGYRDLTGVDPSPEAAAVAAEVHGLRVEIGTFSSLPGGLGTFDCICLTGVLEHLWDIDGAMQAVLGLLRPGGVVYVVVPDASRYLDPYIAPFQDFGAEHVNHFSPTTLAVLAGRYGLETIGSQPADGYMGPGLPFAGIAVTWRRSTDQRDTIDPLERDEALAASLDAFTQRSVIDMGRIEAALEEGLAGTNHFAVWGFGELTMKLLALPPLADRQIVALLDGNPARWGTTVRGVPVASPDRLRDRTVPLVIGSLISEGPIRSEIRRRGMANPLVSCRFRQQ